MPQVHYHCCRMFWCTVYIFMQLFLGWWQTFRLFLLFAIMQFAKWNRHSSTRRGTFLDSIPKAEMLRWSSLNSPSPPVLSGPWWGRRVKCPQWVGPSQQPELRTSPSGRMQGATSPKAQTSIMLSSLSSGTTRLTAGKKCVFINFSVVNSPFFCTMKSQMSWSWERFPKTRTASRIPSMFLLTRSFKSTRVDNKQNKIGWVLS